MMFTELMPKRLELLSEVVPQTRVIALLVNPNNPGTEPVIRVMQEAARAKRVQLQILNAGSESEIDAAFATLVQLQAGALVVSPDTFFGGRRRQLLALAAHHAVPAIYAWREWVAEGGLISYGTSFTAVYHQLGIYAGKILKGAKPPDLPVEQPHIRAGGQSEDRGGARPDRAACDPRPCRRGDRMMRWSVVIAGLAALLLAPERSAAQ